MEKALSISYLFIQQIFSPVIHTSSHFHLWHPTPPLFLHLGGWINVRDAWLRVVPTKFIMPDSWPVSICSSSVIISKSKLLEGQTSEAFKDEVRQSEIFDQ